MSSVVWGQVLLFSFDIVLNISTRVHLFLNSWTQAAECSPVIVQVSNFHIDLRNTWSIALVPWRYL